MHNQPISRILSRDDIDRTWHLHYGDTPGHSDADRLRAELQGRDIAPEQIGLSDVQPFYDELSRVYMTTDCVRGAALLPEGEAISETLHDTPVAVIVESRPHPLLPFVVRQMHAKLGLPIQIFHGPANAFFIKGSSIAPLKAAGHVHLTELASDAVDAGSYNGLMLSRRFHDLMIGRGKILVFQTDALLCPRSPHRLEDFLDYDYIGALSPRRRHSGAVIDGGIGGFSLRDWMRSVDCLERFPPEHWVGAEDDYFGFHIALTGGRVGDQDAQARFATQGRFLQRSFAAHRPFKLRNSDLARFLVYCPQAWPMVRHRMPQMVSAIGQRIRRRLPIGP